jgi:adenine-specific DNA-methyltransferase
MPDTNLDRLKTLLAELFMLDQADLDFGIYRVMNAKRAEVTRFLETDLLPQVRSVLKHHTGLGTLAKQAELDQAIEGAKQLGVNPDSVPKVQELRDALNRDATPDLENEVFSDLTNFFRRYYQAGDFLALRRYKAGVYAIPYEGEEVKLHWANADQYYIKTSEYLRDYTFKLADARRVHFKLVEADTEADNKKPANGQERRFILCSADPLLESNGELIIRFEYRPDPEKRKQADLNALAAQQIFAPPGAASGSPSPGGEGRGEGGTFRNWLLALATPAPTEKNPNRTLLEKHLADYTARNSFDYFIHKDIGGFLRRELDFFIKNEIMHLDDIEDEQATRVEQYLAKVKAIRAIARKIIAFLEQLENFQKKLWLKKKFVVETNYCVTLDRVPESIYPEIAANDPQRAEWVRLFAIDEIKASAAPAPRQGELLSLPHSKSYPPTPSYSVPLTVDFLKANPFLVLDTKFFPTAFRDELLASEQLLGGAPTLDQAIDGSVIYSENFQALSLLHTRYREKVKCIYIDPPYNRGADEFLYKDAYQHSSWTTLMKDRLALANSFLSDKGVIFVSIDENERAYLQILLDGAFQASNRIAELIWVQNTSHNDSPTYSTNHEYIEVYAKNRPLVEKDQAMFREPKPGCEEIKELIAKLNPAYPPIADVERAVQELMDEHLIAFKEQLQDQGLEYDDDTKKLDPWKGIYNYSHTEYRNVDGKHVAEDQAKIRKASLWVWREDNPSAPAGKQAASTRNPDDPNFRFYRPDHPTTGKQCPYPKRGWLWPAKPLQDRQSFADLDADNRIVYGRDEAKVPQVKKFLHEVETNVSKSVVHDYTDGEKELTNILGTTNSFPNPKPTTLIARVVQQTCGRNETVLDFFVGSGATGQAVIDLNRSQHERRQYILVEMANYFATVLKPRIQKVIYSKDWKDGQPVSREGSSHLFKYLRLESYEDALNNLELKRTPDQDDLLRQHDPLREDYMLRYQLDVETRDSASLLNVSQFTNPFAYQLKIATGSVGESRPVNVDLVETFNYLLGLRVGHMDTIRGFRVVQGLNPDGEKVLVIWRNVAEKPNAELDTFFQKQRYNTKDLEFALIYVNGDNNLENLKRADETWKVRRTEDEFKRLMFDVADV